MIPLRAGRQSPRPRTGTGKADAYGVPCAVRARRRGRQGGGRPRRRGGVAGRGRRAGVRRTVGGPGLRHGRSTSSTAAGWRLGGVPLAAWSRRSTTTRGGRTTSRGSSPSSGSCSTRQPSRAADLARARSRVACVPLRRSGASATSRCSRSEPTEDALRALLAAVFQGPWWAQIRFGPLIQGAAYELRLRRPAELSMLDGYLTIDDGGGHLHLCIGPHAGSAQHTRVARARPATPLPPRRAVPHLARRRADVVGVPHVQR